MASTDSSLGNYAARDPDVRLMLEVRDGSATAFEELMLRYQNRVMTVLEHLLGMHAQAEDLTQEVFLRVFRARKSYSPDAKFCTWLFTIVNNVAFNARRGRSRRREVQPQSSLSGSTAVRGLDQMALAASGLMPTRQLDKAEMQDIVRLALDELNERQRLAVLLNKFEGLGYADIATVMDLSPQAVKSLLSRARESLRQILEPYLEHGTRPD
ncbi:MAG: RNA polymerase sigma factor [Pirellulales bacterium]